MNFSIEIDQGSGFVDISRYCLLQPEATAKVPYINRNIDYKPIFDVWETYLSSESGITPAKEDEVKVTIDGTVVFNGYVTKARPSAWESYTQIEVTHYLQKLEGKIWEYNNIRNDLNATSDPFEYHETVYNPVNTLYLMKKLCAKIGVTLITSNVDNVQLFQYKFPEGGGNNTPAFKPVTCKDTYYDFKRLLGINQPDADAYTSYDDANKDYNRNKITFLELFKKICSQFEYDVISTGYKQYSLYRNLGNYTLVNSSIYEGEPEPEEITAQDVLAHWRRASNETHHWYGFFGTQSLNYYNTGKGGSEIDWDPSMRVYFYGYVDGVKASSNAPPEGDTLLNQNYTIPILFGGDAITGITSPDINNYVVTDFKGVSYRPWVSRVYNYNRYEVTQPYSITPKSVTRNSIDLWEETSEIVQDVLTGRRAS